MDESRCLSGIAASVAALADCTRSQPAAPSRIAGRSWAEYTKRRQLPSAPDVASPDGQPDSAVRGRILRSRGGASACRGATVVGAASCCADAVTRTQRRRRVFLTWICTCSARGRSLLPKLGRAPRCPERRHGLRVCSGAEPVGIGRARLAPAAPGCLPTSIASRRPHSAHAVRARRRYSSDRSTQLARRLAVATDETGRRASVPGCQPEPRVCGPSAWRGRSPTVATHVA